MEGIWTDASAGLTWQVNPTENTMTWSAAMTHCQGLSLDGGGWRVPTIGELRSLIQGCPNTELGGTCNVQEGVCLSNSCRSNSCEGCGYTIPPNPQCYRAPEMLGTCTAWYWSSSQSGDVEWNRWCVSFSFAVVDDVGVGNLMPVRCVRDAL